MVKKNEVDPINYIKTTTFWDKIDNKLQGKYSMNYLMQKKHELLAIHRFRKDLNFIISNLPIRRKRFLDLACGSGNYLERLAPYFTYSEGIDNSQMFIKIAKKRFAKNKAIKIRRENIIQCKLIGIFDLINIGEVFVYLNDEDLLKLFKTLNKHMNKNTIITLRESTANKYNINYIKGKHKTIRRTLNHYKKLFRSCDLQIKKIILNYDYNYSWIAALPLNFFPFLLKNKKFINFYMNNSMTRFFFLQVPFIFFTLIRPNYICQYYFLLKKK